MIQINKSIGGIGGLCSEALISPDYTSSYSAGYPSRKQRDRRASPDKVCAQCGFEATPSRHVEFVGSQGHRFCTACIAAGIWCVSCSEARASKRSMCHLCAAQTLCDTTEDLTEATAQALHFLARTLDINFTAEHVSNQCTNRILSAMTETLTHSDSNSLDTQSIGLTNETYRSADTNRSAETQRSAAAGGYDSRFLVSPAVFKAIREDEAAARRQEETAQQKLRERRLSMGLGPSRQKLSELLYGPPLTTQTSTPGASRLQRRVDSGSDGMRSLTSGMRSLSSGEGHRGDCRSDSGLSSSGSAMSSFQFCACAALPTGSSAALRTGSMTPSECERAKSLYSSSSGVSPKRVPGGRGRIDRRGKIDESELRTLTFRELGALLVRELEIGFFEPCESLFVPSKRPQSVGPSYQHGKTCASQISAVGALAAADAHSASNAFDSPNAMHAFSDGTSLGFIKKIRCLRGLPFIRTVGTLVHELLHAWIFLERCVSGRIALDQQCASHTPAGLLEEDLCYLASQLYWQSLCDAGEDAGLESALKSADGVKSMGLLLRSMPESESWLGGLLATSTKPLQAVADLVLRQRQRDLGRKQLPANFRDGSNRFVSKDIERVKRIVAIVGFGTTTKFFAHEGKLEGFGE